MISFRTVAIGLALVLPARAQEPSQDPVNRPVNHLAGQTSPYLLQHAHNPVDWYPWGPEALKRAKDEHKPIFLSIGYSACHWCHVMEHESFEDPAIAKLMNDNFVNIKVDREERPDLDEIYMAAVTGMTGHGGWPMSVWLTPDLEPFYAGTYFPPDDRQGMPGFARVLEHVHRLWSERREDVEKQAGQVAEYLKKALAPKIEPDDPKLADLDRFVAQCGERYDALEGGFGAPGSFAPKFPQAVELRVLLREYARTRDAKTLEMATHTLRAMAEGGIYDQLGGGFHRYSTDRRWLVPHFEKMLYDNALLAQTYVEAFQATGEPLFGRIARETLDYLIREMQDQKGGFWSTTDADSEGVEGKYFVWSKAEVDRLLGDDAPVFCAVYDVTETGNWDGTNVLHVARPVAELAAESGVSAAELEARLAKWRATLLAARGKRVPPATDDKVLAAWNGLAIAALAEGYQVLGDARYLAAARRAADFVLTSMVRDGRVLRSWRDGKANLQGYLEDQAFVADALLRLFESDGDPRWLGAARDLLAAMDEHFLDSSDGSWFFTADDHEALLARTKSVQESSTPSGIAVAILAHLRGSLLLGDPDLWERGLRALRANHVFLSEYPVACATLMLGVDLALADPREVVVAGEPDDARTMALLEAAWRTYPPRDVVALRTRENAGALAAITPIVEGKAPVEGVPAAFVCRRGACEAPVTDPAALAR